ncbi:MAG: putative lipid II flippase FtsW [Ilumatobacteraceae bacterium]|nr:putative lipid II flippase FtsW [Ilumatobacteraceae bacterium]
MSTVVPDRSQAGFQTVAQRRRATLDRSGVSGKRQMATQAPTVAFYGLLVVSALLVMFGLVMVLSASSVTMLHSGKSAFGIFYRQLAWAGIGTFLMWGAYSFPYQMLKKYARLIFIASLVAMFLPFVPGLGASVNGARAWVGDGAWRFQPSELLKLATLIYVARILSKNHRDMSDMSTRLVKVAIVLGSAAGMCLWQKDLGSAIIFGAIVLSIAFVAGAPISRLLGASAIGLFIGGIFVNMENYRRQRFTAFMDVEGNKGHWGYQVYQSMISIANGKFTGVGVGDGAGKWGYVPLAHTDFIFAIIAEELGFVGAISVIGLFFLFIVFGIQAALGARDAFGALLAGGVTAWFGVQAIVNIGGVTGAMPVTGLTLPFISYGGSSLLVTMAATGLLLNVARHMK